MWEAKLGDGRYAAICRELNLASDSLDDVPDRDALCALLNRVESEASPQMKYWVSLNLHLFDLPIRRQSRLVQFSRLYWDAKRTVLRLFRRLLTFTLEDIAMFASAVTQKRPLMVT